MAYIENNDLRYKYQADILTERVTDNPLMPASRRASKNKSLDTQEKNVVQAINRLNKNFQALKITNDTSLMQQLSVLGDYIADEKLIAKLQKVDTSVITAIIKIYKEINGEASDKNDISDIAPSVKEAIRKLDHKVELTNRFTEILQFQADDMQEPQFTFQLSKNPSLQQVVLWVNGIRYLENKHFVVERNIHRKDNEMGAEAFFAELTWTFTESNGGFDLVADDGFELMAEYGLAQDGDENKT